MVISPFFGNCSSTAKRKKAVSNLYNRENETTISIRLANIKTN
jgi:hypothetical protein